MRGVLLAGGMGSRLGFLTAVTNKHLLPVYDRPMIFYPLQTLRDLGIDEVLVVVGGTSTGEIVRLLKDGSEFGFRRMYYAFQAGFGGIADALKLADSFAQGEPIAVILGDNIFPRAPKVPAFRGSAHLVLASVKHPEQYGCPVFDFDKIVPPIIRIEEKPPTTQTTYAVAGLYFYGPDVFAKLATLEPSARHELEISDLNNLYISEGKASWSIYDGKWYDAGSSADALVEVATRIKEQKR